ncbi:putative DNA damage repair protein Mus42 [Aspergillus brunneoviolaceus CBS 621.78]|uniref:DNA repair protein n=1 Tax=Aspergillus brunneoviolaceus CBS 621.78 TaxID=1450534 RepID=A0ACD1GIQ8_9EURO|nr:DNA repair protein [Aspergillus brunneoviolaceus CBS 621.78]RAH48994.1 DNA repair protein [Aspergillus brunneoviolaceus CBS 621.78]
MGSVLDQNSSAVRKRIQNHQFEDEGGEEYDASTFGGFSDYMRRKKLKLQNLDAEIRSSASENPPIFRGVVAHVNGYTQPSLQDLHKLIVSHGGGFLQYLSGKTDATHIIASSLTPKKREEFRRYRIVKPAWVVESVQAGRLLPWDQFRVVDEGHAQKVLKFDNGRILSQTNTSQTGYREQSRNSWYASQLQAPEATSPVRSPLGQPAGSASTETQPNLASQSDYGEFPSFSMDETGNPLPVSQQTNVLSSPKDPEPKKDDPGNDIISPRSNISQKITPSAQQASPSKPGLTSEEYNAQLLMDPRMRNSSVVNPEFIQQYYKESRLHHLSTWKANLKAQLQLAAAEKSQSQFKGAKPVPGVRRYIMHVDFDCFFAAVSTLKHPHLEGKPVAVAHGAGSGSEIASCNYEARAHGIKNGMWMKGALGACPSLQVVPYDFPAYEEASRKFYNAILAIDGIVQSVSIDEALVDITMQCLHAGGSDGRGVSEGSIYREQAKADEIAQALRTTVKEQTGCAVSVGIGGNILQAKVALRKAKPAGQSQLKPDEVLDFIGGLTVQSLPGVGHSMGAKLEELGVKFVKDVRELTRERLTSSLGPKTGVKLWEYARGIDRTEVGNETIRKSVSAEVNWGIRFVNQNQAEDFIRSLCDELHKRLVENLVKGKQLTLKVMRRAADAPLEAVKHLGHGKCDIVNRSVMLGVATNASEVLGREAVAMLRSFGISPGDLRGLGVQMTKLEPLKSGSPRKPDGSQQQLNFKVSPIRRSIERPEDPDDVESPRRGESETVRSVPSMHESGHKPLNISGTQFILPSQIDPQVVAELPNDIRSKLVAQGRSRRDTRSTSPCPPTRTRRPIGDAELPPPSQLDPETLMALPEDVRAEVLGYYTRDSSDPDNQTPEPWTSAPTTTSTTTATTNPPRPTSSSSSSLKLRKPTTPTKRRRGRPPIIKSSLATTLTQAKFVRPNPPPPSVSASASASASTTTTDPQATEVSADFLAALPEDIRQEILEEQRRTRLLQRPALHPSTHARPPTTNNNNAPPQPPREKTIPLPPLPARPTFTANRLTSLPDLRNALKAWYTAFNPSPDPNEEDEADENEEEEEQEEPGPFDEDILSLAWYLKRVVLDERDLDKAVAVVKWLIWLVENDYPGVTADTTGTGNGAGGSSSGSGSDGPASSAHNSGSGSASGSIPGLGFGSSQEEDAFKTPSPSGKISRPEGDGSQRRRQRRQQRKQRVGRRWGVAVRMVKESVLEAVGERGLGVVDFE